MTDKALFLAWQDKRLTREWFPVGRLDVRADKGAYRFCYIKVPSVPVAVPVLIP